MIHSIEIRGLRAIRYAHVPVRPFQVLVGPNASGKSTFIDAFLLLRDILTAGIEPAIYGDLRFNILQRAADPRDLSWLRQGQDIEIVVTFRLPDDMVKRVRNSYRFARYEMAIRTDGVLGFNHETLWLCPEPRPVRPESALQRTLFPASLAVPDHVVLANRKSPKGWRKIVNKVVDSGNDYFRSELSDWNNLFRLGPSKSALASLPEDEDKFPAATWVKRLLMEGAHRLMLNAEAMRMPSPAGSPREFLPDGSNLPWVVNALEQGHEDRLVAWVEHLRTALDDLESIRTVERPEDRSRYLELTYASGLQAPSWLLSDGTLRLLALTLLAYVPSKTAIVMVEEPENGIHPRAIETVVQSLSSVYDAQVYCATHSPVALSLVRPDQLICFGKTADGEVDVVLGNEHPRLREWKSAVHIGDLFAAGVLG